MDIPLDVDVHCSDSVGGHCAAVVLNPVTKVLSHVVVKTKGHAHEEYLVPLDLITDTSVKHIRLSCSLGELGQLAPFIKPVRVEEAGLNMMNAQALAGAESQSGIGYEDFGFGGKGKVETVEEEAIPETELAVRTDTAVHATDGVVGQVDRFFIRAGSGEIMQLVLLEKHLLSKKNFVIAVDQIDRIGEDVVYLALSKHDVEQLPRV